MPELKDGDARGRDQAEGWRAGRAEEEKAGKEGPSEERHGAWEGKEEVARETSDKRQTGSEASFLEPSIYS